MNSSRLHNIESFSITTFTAFSMVSLLIFLSFSRTKTVSIKAASATAKLSPESTRAVIRIVCSGRSFKSQRKRQLVSRLGIVFHNMGFPAVAVCRCYRQSSLLDHLFLQEPSDILNLRRFLSSIGGSVGGLRRGYRSKGQYGFTYRNRPGNLKGNPAIGWNFNNLLYGHKEQYTTKTNRKQGALRVPQAGVYGGHCTVKSLTKQPPCFKVTKGTDYDQNRSGYPQEKQPQAPHGPKTRRPAVCR